MPDLELQRVNIIATGALNAIIIVDFSLSLLFHSSQECQSFYTCALLQWRDCKTAIFCRGNICRGARGA